MLVVVCMQGRKLHEALHVQVDHHVTHGMRPEQRTVSVAYTVATLCHGCGSECACMESVYGSFYRSVEVSLAV